MRNSKAFGLFIAGWRPIKKEMTLLVCERAHISFSFFPLRQAMRNSKAFGLFIAGWRPIKKETNGILCE